MLNMKHRAVSIDRCIEPTVHVRAVSIATLSGRLDILCFNEWSRQLRLMLGQANIH